MGLEDPLRPPALNDQGLVATEVAEGRDDPVVVLPRARRLARAAVHDEVLGSLGDIRVEVVHQHAQGGFLHPALARPLRAVGRPNLASHIGRRLAGRLDIP